MTTLAPTAPWPYASAPTPPDAPVYVHPGRVCATDKANSLATVVGSGVAVCVWDPAHRAGGIAHFLLPEAGNASAAQRYGDVGMKSLLDQLAALGANVRGLRARVYGGSAPPIASESGHLGDRNVAQALAFLSARGIPVLERDIGGTGARKVVFDPRSGAVELSRLGNS